MAASGHITAQVAQPVQLFSGSGSAKAYPLALSFCETDMTFLGQKAMQYPHPLHNAVSMMIFPFMGTITSIYWLIKSVKVYPLTGIMSNIFRGVGTELKKEECVREKMRR